MTKAKKKKKATVRRQNTAPGTGSSAQSEVNEKAFDEAISRSTMYIRDCNLSPVYAAAYVPGTVFEERDHFVASARVGGMAMTHRFAILSNHMTDLSWVDGEANFGTETSEFMPKLKVLDVYEYEGKTQILLLHLPKDCRWKDFCGEKPAAQEQVILQARKKFEEVSGKDPFPELLREEWVWKCMRPVGMDTRGRLHRPESYAEDLLKPVEGASFREFFHRFVYLNSRRFLKELPRMYYPSSAEGVLAYGFIDRSGDLRLLLVKPARLEEDRMKVLDAPDFEMLEVRTPIEVFRGASYLDLASFTAFEPQDYSRIAERARERFETEDKSLEETRSFTYLDHLRVQASPDYVRAVLLRGMDTAPENAWVRLKGTAGGDDRYPYLTGELVTEPKGNFGVHKGDTIQMHTFRYQGMMICVLKEE